ncbi:MAG: hypothetical protein QOI06_2710 [Nocardioidaceae bacterium]|jgi:hypothetical protein|nr:hypothetical protein [Nocardioidaceae bacterium]
MPSATRGKKQRHNVASVPPPVAFGEDLLDQIVAFRPIEITTVETSRGMTEATICQVVTVEPDGQPRNRGEIPILWIVVRDQLRAATTDVPWIAGVLTKAGRAYRLRDLTPEETDRVRTALDQLPD